MTDEEMQARLDALDPFDRQALADAYREHAAAAKAFDNLRYTPGEEERNEQRYFDTQLRVDELVERFGLDYEDDISNLEPALDTSISD
jgi:hypothetical protein